MADGEFRSNVAASAPTGVSCFHRNFEFTKGCEKFVLAVHKDEGLNQMYEGLKDLKPMRRSTRGSFLSWPKPSEPMLTSLKTPVAEAVGWGVGPGPLRAHPLARGLEGHDSPKGAGGATLAPNEGTLHDSPHSIL